MDDDDLRRGRPSNHMVYGQGLAILAGDGLLTLAFQVLAAAAAKGADAGRVARAVEVIAAGAGPDGMVAGQCADLAAEGSTPDAELVDFIHLHKTAALLAASPASGAVMGGGTQEDIDALESYGRSIGLAFQIIDDILDIEGETAALGKPAGSDLARGKATYPGVMGLEASREAARDLVGRALDDLAVFGAAADPLREIGAYLLTRKM